LPRSTGGDAALREYLKDCHVVDGGYVDNEGAFTAATWVRRLLEHYDPSRRPRAGGARPRPFDRVLFLRIFPFPPDRPPTEGGEAGGQGWLNEFTGPLTALQNVRVTSQADRNSFGLELLETTAHTEDSARLGRYFQPLVDDLRRQTGPHPRRMTLPQEFVQRFGARLSDAATDVPGLPVTRPAEVVKVQFVFRPVDDDGREDPGYVTPLSWKLTGRQKRYVDSAWDDIRRVRDRDLREKRDNPDSAFFYLDQYFGAKPAAVPGAAGAGG